MSECRVLSAESHRTIQGSILGPILYAIFVSPLFDLADLTNFADDNFIIRWNTTLVALIEDMKKTWK